MRGVWKVDTGTLREVVLDEDEILSTWSQIMVEWGHYLTAHDLRYPTQDEAVAVRIRSCAEQGCD